MIVSADPVELDPIYLLLDVDSRFNTHPFRDTALAAAINEHLADDSYASIRLIPPSENGLDRWSIEWQEWGTDPVHHVVPKDVRSPVQARADLPSAVASALRHLGARTITLAAQ